MQKREICSITGKWKQPRRRSSATIENGKGCGGIMKRGCFRMNRVRCGGEIKFAQIIGNVLRGVVLLNGKRRLKQVGYLAKNESVSCF
jgi:hypothetical protein